jgi:hypothetical protein
MKESSLLNGPGTGQFWWTNASRRFGYRGESGLARHNESHERDLCYSALIRIADAESSPNAQGGDLGLISAVRILMARAPLGPAV